MEEEEEEEEKRNLGEPHVLLPCGRGKKSALPPL